MIFLELQCFTLNDLDDNRFQIYQMKQFYLYEKSIPSDTSPSDVTHEITNSILWPCSSSTSVPLSMRSSVESTEKNMQLIHAFLSKNAFKESRVFYNCLLVDGQIR